MNDATVDCVWRIDAHFGLGKSANVLRMGMRLVRHSCLPAWRITGTLARKVLLIGKNVLSSHRQHGQQTPLQLVQIAAAVEFIGLDAAYD